MDGTTFLGSIVTDGTILKGDIGVALDYERATASACDIDTVHSGSRTSVSIAVLNLDTFHQYGFAFFDGRTEYHDMECLHIIRKFTAEYGSILCRVCDLTFRRICRITADEGNVLVNEESLVLGFTCISTFKGRGRNIRAGCEMDFLSRNCLIISMFKCRSAIPCKSVSLCKTAGRNIEFPLADFLYHTGLLLDLYGYRLGTVNGDRNFSVTRNICPVLVHGDSHFGVADRPCRRYGHEILVRLGKPWTDGFYHYLERLLGPSRSFD